MKKTGKGSLLAKIAGVSAVFIFIVVLVLTGYGVWQMRQTCSLVADDLVQDEVKSDLAALQYRIADQYGDLSLSGKSLLDSRGQALDGRYDMVDAFSKEMNVVATIFVRDGDDFRRLITSIVDTAGKRAVGTMLGKGSAAYKPVMAGQTYVGKARILGKQYITVYAPVFDSSKSNVIGIDFAGVEISTVNQAIDQRSKVSAITMILISLALLVISVILTMLVFRRVIIKPVRKIQAGLKTMADGDLTGHVSIANNDEIGEIGRSLDQTTDSIKGLLSKIEAHAQSLSGVGQNLAASTAETAAAINEMTANIEAIKSRIVNQSASVTETNASMEKLTGNLQQLDGQVDKQGQSISQSSAAIEEMTASIQSVVQTLQANTESVENLAKAADVGKESVSGVLADIQEISKESESLLEINAVMQNIASQTNLLSMNAAIEAAHAGEAGKGFAVVADEIRKLAENSSEQSKTISNALKKIKGSIDKITGSTGAVLENFEAIEEGVKTVSNHAANIHGAMEEQSTGSQQILEVIKSLNEISAQVKDSSKAMLEESGQVIKESQNLESATAEISNGITEMATGAEQINTAVSQVNSVSTENKQHIDTLRSEVAKFKV
jgi:methyl-accepting chemotaxis protein